MEQTPRPVISNPITTAVHAGFWASPATFRPAIKTVAEWFPSKERALATGMFTAGSNVGAVLGPTPGSTLIGVGCGFLVHRLFKASTWLLLWLISYDSPERHPREDVEISTSVLPIPALSDGLILLGLGLQIRMLGWRPES
jgi:MFS family permease